MRTRALIVLVLLTVFTHVRSPAAAGAGIVKSDRILDPGSGTVHTGAMVVVEGEHIRSVFNDTDPAPTCDEGESCSPADVCVASDESIKICQGDGTWSTVPSDRIVDLGNTTLLPGLLDMHTHLTSDLQGDWRNRPVRETVADAALRGARNAQLTLEAGITTVRDLGAAGFSDVALKRAIDAGLLDGPRIFPAGQALGITGGHCDATGFAPGVVESGPEAGVADGVDDVIRGVRYQIKHGAKVVKVCATAGVLSDEGSVGAQQYSDAELHAVVGEAERHGLRVAAHVHGVDGAIAAIEAGVASIEHGHGLVDGPDDAGRAIEVFRLMKSRGTYLVPTIELTRRVPLDEFPDNIRAKAEALIPLASESIRLAIAEGVKIALGTDAAVLPHGENAAEFQALVDLGMSPMEAIRAATTNAAELLGEPKVGNLRVESYADLIAVEGNPLDDIRAMRGVVFVMKGGKVFKRPNSPVAGRAATWLTPQTSIEFATPAMGSAVLGEPDEFVNAMSPFDRAARLKVDHPVDVDGYLEFVTAEVRAWEREEIDRVSDIVGEIREKLGELRLPLPQTVILIKTTGREEAGKNYTRKNAIVLPQSTIDAGRARLSRVLAHELFHVFSRFDPSTRERLYSAVGFVRAAVGGIENATAIYEVDSSGLAELKRSGLSEDVLHDLQSLKGRQFEGVWQFQRYVRARLGDDRAGRYGEKLLGVFARSRRITNPDAPVIEHLVPLQVRGETVHVVPILFSRLPLSDIEWDPREPSDTFFSYLQSRFLVVERQAGEWRPAILADGRPLMLDELIAPDIWNKVGENTHYILHPEETLADNFVCLLYPPSELKSPWVLEAMRAALEEPEGRSGAAAGGM